MLPHRCTGFPFVLHGHPGGRENHHFRWDRSLNFYSAAELLLPGSESHTRKRSLFSLPTPEWDKPSLGSPGFQHLASCMKPPQPCFQCHHYLSPYIASSVTITSLPTLPPGLNSPPKSAGPAMPPASYTHISSGIVTFSHQLHINRTQWDKEEPKKQL